ncbi:helix-turn-helix domain-containing protein [Agrobacterium tumefaciens]|uniref:helix-turn-helix domain-containing protein n=1 Tax=Agrobacterium tumefaciens TaxID=358 RepID=UPI002243499C|nr:helix-turn-helix transcriptional regulator [Agrobacterium tumefaciens]
MSRGSAETDGPHPVDIHVGQRVRMRRNQIGMSQSTLGENLGITFQQVQKCERGTNRISTSKLFEIAAALGVPITYFFADLALENKMRCEPVATLERHQAYLASKEGYQVVDTMSQLPGSLRRRILSLLVALRRGEDEEDGGGSDT